MGKVTIPKHENKNIETKLTKKGYLVKKSDLSESEIMLIKKELNILPKMNANFADDVKPVKCFKQNSEYFILPRFYGISRFGKPKKVIGMKGNSTSFKFNTELREYQKPIVEESLRKIKDEGGGILKLPCGAGKTVLGIYIASKLKRKTLIIVHKTFLLEQWKERISQFTDAKIGILRQNTIDVEGKDIVVGLLQSIIRRKYDKSIMNQFGTVIYDECHHLGSRKFSEVMFQAGAKYVIGLSATPTRADGLTKIINHHINKIIFKMNRKADKRVQVRILNFKTTNKLFKECKRWIKGSVRPNPVKMIGNLTEIKQRNEVIVNVLKQILKEKERKVIVLSWRLSHLDELRKMVDSYIADLVKNGLIEENELTTSHYVGGMKAEALENASEADIIFSTFAMAEEGLDIPDLNTVFFVTPKKNVIQSVGRILRKQLQIGDISPLVLDLGDDLSVFNNWTNYRGDYYNKNNYNIEDVYFYDDNLVNEYNFIKKIEKHTDEQMNQYYPKLKNDPVTMEQSFDITEIFELAEDPFSDSDKTKSDDDEIYDEYEEVGQMSSFLFN